MKVNAFDLFLRQKRFDLIFKYIYLKNKDKKTQFFENLYAEHIRAFNGFYEENPSDNVPKNSREDFIKSFDKLYENMSKKGFDKKLGIIPIGDNGEISDGAHRLTCAAFLGLDVELQEDHRNDLYDYKFFQNQNINPDAADYAALEYVKLNPNAYIVNLQSVTEPKFDADVESILEKYGFIYYKKNVDITFNGLVNLKKLSYGSFWERESWIGNAENGFAGAVYHANNSFGKNPLRVYVFVCEKLADVLAAKAEIRALFNIGNFCVHINDTREEAIALAQAYFNKNSLYMINKRPYQYEDQHFDDMVMELRNTTRSKGIDIDDVCGGGSTPLDVFGLRKSDDFDFLYCGNKDFNLQTDTLSNHDTELAYYPCPKQEIILNPEYHFYYQGVKIITLDVLSAMKQKRHEVPKDVNDCKMIKAFQRGKKYRKSDFKIFRKIRDGQKRTLVFFDLIKIRYTKKG